MLSSRLCFDYAGTAERLPIFFSLVGIEGAESGERFCKGLAVSDVARDDERIAGAGMPACQQFPADFTEGHETAAGKIGEIDRAFVVVELSYQELTGADICPAEKGVGLHLHRALAVHYALTVLSRRMQVG